MLLKTLCLTRPSGALMPDATWPKSARHHSQGLRTSEDQIAIED